MTVNVKIDNNKLQKDLLKKYLKKVNYAVNELKKEVDKNTPEDTKKLLQNNRVKPAQIIGNKISGSVYNSTDYAYFVEYGVGDRVYKYHKPKGNVFNRGIGNSTFTRSSDYIQSNLDKILEQG